MSVTVLPLQPGEAPRCACCNKVMPSKTRVTFYNSNGGDPEAQLAAYQTNHRVIALRRKWHHSTDWRTDAVTKHLSYIELVLFPEAHRWGYDGVFCTLQCGYRFGVACHQAGNRRQFKSAKKEAA